MYYIFLLLRISILNLFFLVSLYGYKNTKSCYDLTLIGRANFSDSLSRPTLSLVDSLYKDLKINFIVSVGSSDFTDLSYIVKQIVLNQSYPTNPHNAPIAFFSEMLATKICDLTATLSSSLIKIAYSMLESDQIPNLWVKILNNKFDAVVVPDDYYTTVYKDSGVTIPIFTIPCGLYLEPFLAKPLKTKPQAIFTFGCAAAFWPRKNCLLLAQAFAHVFKNNKNIKLKIHGREGNEYNIIKRFIEDSHITNIELSSKILTYSEYLEFMFSLDAYILISKGEGFSITPREAIAMGIPTIITNNTAHENLCKTGFFRAISCPLRERAYYPFIQDYCGYEFNCHREEVSEALQDVYDNYQNYLTQAYQGREWVKFYRYQNLKNYYLSLFKPKQMILGTYNQITENSMITNSLNLYNKYKSLGL